MRDRLLSSRAGRKRACLQPAADSTIDIVTQPGCITFIIADDEVSAAGDASLQQYNDLDEAEVMSLLGKML